MKKAQLIEAIENHQQTEELIIDEPIEEVVPEVIPEVTEEVEPEADIDIKVDEEITSENVSDAPDDVQEEKSKKNKKRLIEYKGETKTLTAWAKELGIRHQTLYNRIVMKGMDPVEAFEMPLKKAKKEVETA